MTKVLSHGTALEMDGDNLLRRLHLGRLASQTDCR